jgi:UDP-N-acetylmuramoyl-tripeptide--D-alanyl-D-alanine ligase
MRATLGWIAASTGGRLEGADREVAGLGIDTRTLAPGELFAAIRGERFDGHDFAAAALERGAVALLVARRLPLDLPQVVVDDTTLALGRLARAWRERHAIPVVGVGGSNGKTTTKEMIAAILAENGAVLATRGNLNNHIGVPLTLLGLDDAHRAAVVEMGANHPGEIAALVQIVRPTVAIITNAGAEHLEGFGSLEGVAVAEGEMVAGLEVAATAVINAGDEFAPLWRRLARAGRVLTFGAAPDADFRAEDRRARIEDGAFVTEFTLRTPAGSRPVRLALAGAHNVVNAQGAAAAAVAAGASLDAVAAGLARVRPVQGRLQLKATPHGAWIIDDSYNANPSSVRAGIDTLVSLDARRLMVLGEMAELGTHTLASHEEAGDYARARGVELLYCLGAPTAHSARRFGDGARFFVSVEELVTALEPELGPGVCVLVKGSRVNRLERVVDALTGAAPRAACGGMH